MSSMYKHFHHYHKNTLALILLLFCMFALMACSDDKKSNSAAVQSLTLSGEINVKTQTSVDSDVMERASVFFDNNNSEDRAQLLTNPITLGGYVSGSSLYYTSSDTSFSEDVKDVYKVGLLAGQTVSLSTYLASAGVDDAGEDLQLDITLSVTLIVDDDEESVLSLTFDRAAAKSLVVPQTGEYIITVSSAVNSAPALYVLSLSEDLSVEDSALLSIALNTDFVPDEVLVKSNSPAAQKVRTKNNKWLKLKREIGSKTHLYSIDVDMLKRSRKGMEMKAAYGTDSKVAKKWQTLKAIELIKTSEGVAYAEPNYIRKPTLVPNDPSFSQQWNLNMVKAAEAWDISQGSAEVRVAVIDSGIDTNHEDLIDNISSEGFDFVSDFNLSGDGDGLDNHPQDLSETKHGSHVAGIIGAATNNGLGVASLGFNTTIVPLRVLGVEDDEGEVSGNDADIAQAIRYAAGLENDSGIILSEPVDIINLSLGSGVKGNTLNDAIQDALAQNVVVVAAAGNDGSSEPFYPAAYDGVIGVSAVTSLGELAGFSNFGNYIDVAAPGGANPDQDFNVGEQGVLSTVNQSDYVQYAGTSMAAPHVSAVIALMRAVNPELAYTTIISAMRNSLITDVVGDSRFFGGGLINAEKALTWARDGNSVPDELSFFPRQFSFVNKNTNADLYLSNSGQGSVVISSITANQSWIEVNELQVDSAKLGRYQVRVSNSSAIDTGEITIQFTINGADPTEVVIPVVSSNSVSTNESVGNLFISLFTPESFENLQSDGVLVAEQMVAGRLSNGVYSFTFSDIAPGSYYIRASTNNDGDPFLFDKGEAVGWYPNYSRFERIDVSEESVSGLDFEVQFYEQNITSQGASALQKIQ